MLSGKAFGKAGQMARMLRFLVDKRRNGEASRLKETEIGTAVFGREVGYDPKADSIVRVEATRLRKKLAQYYEGEGAGDAVWIRLPAGKYELEFLPRPEPEVGTGRTERVEARAAHSVWRVAGAAAIVVVVMAAVVWWLSARVQAPAATILDGHPLTFQPGHEDSPAVSPDGKTVAYTWDGKPGEKAISLQPLDGQGSPRKLNADGKMEASPVWSRDGMRIAYLSWREVGRAEIRIRDLVSGAGETVGEIAATDGEQPGLSWSPDGRWLLSSENDGGKMQLVLFDRQTGKKQGYLRGSSAGTGRANPVFSPSGRKVAFVQGEETASSDVWVAEFPGESAPRRITNDRTMFRGITWLGDDERLLASSYRERGRAGLWLIDVRGTEGPVRWTDGASEYRYPAYSATRGQVVYSKHTGNVHVWRRNGNWRQEGEAWIRATGLNSSAQFSPDGSRVALRSNRSGRSEIWVVEAATGESRRLTYFNGPVTGSPRWSPDGKKIAFDSRLHGKADIFVIDAAEGAKPVRLTTDDGWNEVVPSWSADGGAIYYASDREGGAWSLWKRTLADGSDKKVLSNAFSGTECEGHFYYSRGPRDGGLYRMRLSDGVVEPVVPELRSSMWGNWAVHARQGLVYVAEDAEGGVRLLQKSLVDLAKKPTDLGSVAGVVRWDGGLALSPDGETLLLARLGDGDSDLLWAAVPQLR